MLVHAKIDASQIAYEERDLMEIYPTEFPDCWVVRGYKGYDISEFVKKWNGEVANEDELNWMLAERAEKKAIDAVRRVEILAELAALDIKAIRPLRDGETDRVNELAKQTKALRSELAGLV